MDNKARRGIQYFFANISLFETTQIWWHHLSDNYVDLSDHYIFLSVNYVDLSKKIMTSSFIYLILLRVILPNYYLLDNLISGKLT